MLRLRSGLVFVGILGMTTAFACAREPAGGAKTAPTGAERAAIAEQEAASPSGGEDSVVDDALGGRLYDRFYDGEGFSPDRSSSPGNADGQGGPFGNGTLPGRDGQPLLNDAGHDYRLKNLFGWDLRGAQGIYGARFQNKATVVDRNLLDPEADLEEIRGLLRDGSEVVPAYGSVLDASELDSLVAFVGGIRDGRLPHPDRIWTLSEGTPGNYRLVAGGDPEHGKELFADRCAGCHGKDGTKMLFDDDEYSLGSHARQKAYEDWLKILNGQPHTKMKRFVKGADAAELGQQVLDLLAALCDRAAFPLGAATHADVPDGDPRCGSYLR